MVQFECKVFPVFAILGSDVLGLDNFKVKQHLLHMEEGCFCVVHGCAPPKKLAVGKTAATEIDDCM